MIHLLYVSYSLIPEKKADQVVLDIVSSSVTRNNNLDVTGALVFTGVNFAQFLEGPERAVLDLMESIRGDARHKDVWVVAQAATDRRRFNGWSMAYGGRSGFVSRQITEILDTATESKRDKASEKIIEMMDEFAK